MIFDLRNRQGERIDHTFTPGQEGDRRMVVVAHGVTSHKERPSLILLCDRLAKAGIASLRITFPGNPGSEGCFEDATISKEVDDLRSVLDALDSWDVIYAGHSMGGAVGVLCAAGDDRVRRLVSLAGMVHVQEFMQRVFGHLEPGEFMLDKPHCPLSTALLDDAELIGDVLEQAAQVQVPWLLVHGGADELVPLQDSSDVRAAADNRPQLIELEGIDHRFGGAEEAMARAVVDWIQKGD